MFGQGHLAVIPEPALEEALPGFGGVHPGQKGVYIQPLHSGEGGEFPTETDGVGKLLGAFLQQRLLPGGGLGEGEGTLEDLPHLLQGHIQHPQEPDELQDADILLRVASVVVVRIPCGAEKPLLFIKADVVGGHAGELLGLLDGHGLNSFLS